MKDVDDTCIGGCVAKRVTSTDTGTGTGQGTEELKFFNTVCLRSRDITIKDVRMKIMHIYIHA